MHCDVCGEDICLGDGGILNWHRHLKSAAHLQKQKATEGVQKISTYFQQKTTKEAPVSLLAPRKFGAGPHHPSPTILPPPPSNNEPIDVDADVVDPAFSSSDVTPDAHTLDLLQRLKQCTKTLPRDVPLASAPSESNPLSAFAYPPNTDTALRGDAAWEDLKLDRVLNNLCGYNMSAETFKERVVQGPYGMDGVCTWIETCIRRLALTSVHLEGKIECMIGGMKLRYVPDILLRTDVCSTDFAVVQRIHTSAVP